MPRGLTVNTDRVTSARRSTQFKRVPVTLAEANAFVAKHHRHHRPVRGCVCCIGAECNGAVVGVVIVGRPVARMLDDGDTAELLRVCSDGTRNACSFLLGAARRAVGALGYSKAITYTLSDESGVSLNAAGWMRVGPAGGGSWSRAERPRIDRHPLQAKIRWECAA